MKSNSVLQTEEIGANLAEKLSAGNVVALYGGLGMGKTALVRGIAKGIGFNGEVSSPTFSIVHEYLGGRLPLFHFDMYRINGWDDLYSTNFFEYLEMGGILITEWSENIEAALPEHCCKIIITRGETPEERIFNFENIEC